MENILFQINELKQLRRNQNGGSTNGNSSRNSINANTTSDVRQSAPVLIEQPKASRQQQYQNNLSQLVNCDINYSQMILNRVNSNQTPQQRPGPSSRRLSSRKNLSRSKSRQGAYSRSPTNSKLQCHSQLPKSIPKYGKNGPLMLSLNADETKPEIPDPS